MFTKFGILFVLTIIAVQNSRLVTGQPNSSELQQGFTTRCDELCSNEIQEVGKFSIYLGRTVGSKSIITLSIDRVGLETGLSTGMPILQH